MLLKVYEDANLTTLFMRTNNIRIRDRRLPALEIHLAVQMCVKQTNHLMAGAVGK